jgi:hypothetical protein
MHVDGYSWHDCKKLLVVACIALVEGENNESWKWFFDFVRKQVLGPDR